MTRAAALVLACLLPQAALAEALACGFTTLCSPLTDCQTADPIPFRFEVTGDAVTLSTPQGDLTGRPLGNVTAPGLALIFDTAPDSTLLLTLSPSGEAVMTQHDILAGGRIQAVSFFGTCEPAT